MTNTTPPLITFRSWPLLAQILVYLLLLAVGILASASSAADGRLSVSVDRNELALNETLELTVEWQGAAQSQPDFSALRHQFEILGSHQSSQTSMVGTDIDTVTRWHLTLLPQETGTLIIPSLHFGQTISDALEIQVREARQTARGERGFWLESSVDREQAHIGEQIILTYRLYYATPLRQMTREDLIIEGADLVALRERQFQTIIEDTGYQVAELRFALFPTRAGTLSIPALRLNGYSSEGSHPRLGGLIRGLGNPINLASDTHTVEILPRPPGSPNVAWLPAKSLSLSEQWSHDDQPIRVGDPITRTVRIDAEGVTAQQLPEIEFGRQPAYRIYPEQPRLQQRETEAGLLASRTESHALIATQPGSLTLPDLSITWWDTETDQWREAVVAGKTIEVLPAPLPSLPGDSAPESGGPQPATGVSGAWHPVFGLSLALNVFLTAIVLGHWWRRRVTSKQPVPETSGSPTLKEAEQYAKQGDPRAFRRAVLDWSRMQWTEQPPMTLPQLATRAGRTELSRLLAALDEALYDRDASVDSALLRAILRELKTAGKANKIAAARSEELPPLYPS